MLLVSAVQFASSGELGPTLATAARYGLCNPQMAFALSLFMCTCFCHAQAQDIHWTARQSMLGWRTYFTYVWLARSIKSSVFAAPIAAPAAPHALGQVPLCPAGAKHPYRQIKQKTNVCIYMYMYTYKHIYIYIYVYICIYSFVCNVST